MSELAEHLGYWRDDARTARYREALAEVVRPGMVVLDLGAGTGIMGLLSLQAGAAHVHAVDSGPILEVARQIAVANGVDHITYHRTSSDRLVLPEPVDLVVCDQHDPTGIRAGLLHSLHDASRRLLAPGGIAVPSHVTICAAPAAVGAVADDLAFWRSRPTGFDTSVVARLAANEVTFQRVPAGDLLSAPLSSDRIDTVRHGDDPVRITGEVVIEQAGTITGLALWFRSQLSPSIVLTNSPDDPDAIARDQALLPLETPIEVVAGDRVGLEIRVGPEIHWRVTPTVATPTSAWQSTMAGHRLGPDDLLVRLPGHHPVLSDQGRLLARLADLLTTGATVADLRQVVIEEFPDELRVVGPEEVVDWAVRLLSS